MIEIGLVMDKVLVSLEISIKRSITFDTYYYRVYVSLDGLSFMANLVVMITSDDDMIIGRDCLARHHTV